MTTLFRSVVLTLCLLPVSNCSAEEPTPVSLGEAKKVLSQIRADWTERFHQIDRLQMEYSEEITIFKGARTDDILLHKELDSTNPAFSFPEGTIFPPEDRKYTTRTVWKIDRLGARVRHTYQG